MIDQGCWTSEYDWIYSPPSYLQGSAPTETIISILFDGGTQRRFSAVRLSLLSSDAIGATDLLHKPWITPLPSAHISAQDTPVTQDDPRLPICHVVFMVDQGSVIHGCGPKLVLTEPGSARSSTKLFEFDHPLTEDTRSVSFSFVSPCDLSTEIRRDNASFFELLSNRPATVGRVVRVIPMAGKRRTIPLPTDVLLVVFDNLRSPLTYQGWRRDLLNSGLTCRQWTCALNLLLLDFRSPESQHPQGEPPEVTSLACGLAARPSLGLGIKYLSMGYLMKRNPGPDTFPGLSGYQQFGRRRWQFAKAFLSILRVAKNVQNLDLDSVCDISPDDLADTLSGLNKLETFTSRLEFTMAELLSCVAPCSSLKRLSIFDADGTSDDVSFPSPSFQLTELVLEAVSIEDDELACLANASRSTLSRLSLSDISGLTNAGLRAALTAVCASLTCLDISDVRMERERGEERALDATIAHMVRLTDLKIEGDVASRRMVQRRAEAFSAVVLPEVHLHMRISQAEVNLGKGLAGAVARCSPGWRFDVDVYRLRQIASKTATGPLRRRLMNEDSDSE